MRTNKWTYELFNEEVWTSGENFDTKEEAIEAGREAIKDDKLEIDFFWIGQIVDYIPTINEYRIIDDLVEDAAEQCGEVSDSFLDGMTEEQIKQLGLLLNETLNKWLEETKNQPNFYRIVNVESIAVKEDK
jgi:hypothetical protein